MTDEQTISLADWVVHKHVLPPASPTHLSLPYSTEWLHVGEQDGDLVVWERHPDNAANIAHHDFELIVVGTDWATAGINPMTTSHLGSVQMSNGLVWHVFVVGRWVRPPDQGEIDQGETE